MAGNFKSPASIATISPKHFSPAERREIVAASGEPQVPDAPLKTIALPPQMVFFLPAIRPCPDRLAQDMEHSVTSPTELFTRASVSYPARVTT
ncbi:hypothetical protein PERCYII40_2477 [Pseudomonas aeruginosa]|nr:hypothetical protein PERCYII10_2249 [Pseudomonas aeruginosa]VZR84979.1 hypothetical protein PERCYII29_2314 [Pseudomonas aeruginosa]VZR85067.1 hypothetical protein PACF725_2336 [Pseudomonas aeruginosa]VZR85525.1 hypothetical protein PERCYII40_2477 [Pseudomonas aeruginosa]